MNHTTCLVDAQIISNQTKHSCCFVDPSLNMRHPVIALGGRWTGVCHLKDNLWSYIIPIRCKHADQPIASACNFLCTLESSCCLLCTNTTRKIRTSRTKKTTFGFRHILGQFQNWTETWNSPIKSLKSIHNNRTLCIALGKDQYRVWIYFLGWKMDGEMDDACLFWDCGSILVFTYVGTL